MTTNALTDFLAEPGGHILLDTDCCVLDVGPYYLRITLTDRDYWIGKRLTDVFPTHGVGHNQVVISIKASVQRAIEMQQPDKMGIVRVIRTRSHDVDKPDEECWWEITHVPIVEEGKVSRVVQRIEDHTLLLGTKSAIDKQNKKNVVLYACCIIAVVLVAFVGFRDNTEIKDVANLTCKVQSRGLPAQREVSQVMQDIDRILTAIPSNSTRTSSTYRAVVPDLQKHLRRYVQITAQQPHSRNC